MKQFYRFRYYRNRQSTMEVLHIRASRVTARDVKSQEDQVRVSDVTCKAGQVIQKWSSNPNAVV